MPPEDLDVVRFRFSLPSAKKQELCQSPDLPFDYSQKSGRIENKDIGIFQSQPLIQLGLSGRQNAADGRRGASGTLLRPLGHRCTRMSSILASQPPVRGTKLKRYTMHFQTDATAKHLADD